MSDFSREDVATLLSIGNADPADLISKIQNEDGNLKEDAVKILKTELGARVKGLTNKEFIHGRNKAIEESKSFISDLYPEFKTESNNRKYFEDLSGYIKSNVEPIKEVVEVEKNLDITKEFLEKNETAQEWYRRGNEAIESKYTTEVESLQNEVSSLRQKEQNRKMRKHLAIVASQEGILHKDLSETAKNVRIDTMLLHAQSNAPGGFKFGDNDDSPPIPLDGDKRPLKDESFYEYSWTDFVMQKVNRGGDLFPVHKHDPQQKAPDIQQEQRRTPNSSKAFKDFNDFATQSANEADPQKRAELKTSWEAQEAAQG